MPWYRGYVSSQEDACCWVSSIFLSWFFPVSFRITNWWTSVLNTKIIHLMTPTRMHISWPRHGSLRMINSCHQHTCVHVYHVYININIYIYIHTKSYHVLIHLKAYACIDLRLRTHGCKMCMHILYVYIRTHSNQHLAGQSLLKIPGASTRETKGKQLECFVKMLDLLEISSSTSMDPANS